MNRHGNRVVAFALTLVLVFGLCAPVSLADAAIYPPIKLNVAQMTVAPDGAGEALFAVDVRAGSEPIQWTSSDPAIAEYDSATGRVVAKAASGRAVITARGAVSGVQASCVVTVKAVAVQSIRITASNVIVAPGRTHQFSCALKPANSTDKTVTWSLASTNAPDDIAARSRFDPAAQVFTAGQMVGEALILTATASSGATAQCTIHVRDIPVAGLKFRKTSGSLAAFSSYDMNRQLVVLPESAGNPAVTWSSGNESIATIDDEGIVTVLRDGAVRITATSVENPALSASFKLTGTAVRVKSIKLDRSSAVADPSEQFSLRASVSPSSASFPGVVWSSDAPGVATVDELGNVTAVGPGKAIITASADLGRAAARMVVRVRGGNMRTVKISSMGDVVLGGDKKSVPKADKPIGDGLTSMKRFAQFYRQFGAAYFFAGVQGVLSQDDLSIINLEGTITTATNAAKKTYAFKAPPEYTQILNLGSIEVASLANNHSEDYFSKGFSDTKKYLSRAGITSIGFGSGGISTRTVNGVKVGFAGFCIPVTRSSISSAIKSLKKNKKCDIVIVQFHWAHSKEWTNKVYSQEKTLSRYAITCGADLVVGHHKHQVSGIERYKNKMIAYDVGNFVAMVRNKIDGKYLDKASMIYQQKFNVFDDGYVEVCDPNIIPVMISDGQDVLTGNPHIVDGAEAERVLGIVRRYTPASSAHLVKTDPNY